MTVVEDDKDPDRPCGPILTRTIGFGLDLVGLREFYLIQVKAVIRGFLRSYVFNRQ